jgi:ATP-dependent DNA helicase RecQ
MLEEHLKQHFKFDTFRPGQREVIQSIVDGNDTLAIMPTGGGKSLCYQLPALINDNITLVVSPLIALMKDQVDALQARGIPSAFINSSLETRDIREIEQDVRSRSIQVLYVAPERFKSPRFARLLSEIDIGLFAVDEAHCISQWGHDFRPDYRIMAEQIKGIRNRPTVAAFTATATPEVNEDIVKRLQLKDPHVYVRGFNRSNLHFFAREGLKDTERVNEVLRLVKSMKGSGIVYALRKKETEEIATFLTENGVKAVAYHAGLDKNLRTRIQQDFMDDKYKVIVATIAFGMGVDKADVRFVIHAGMPKTLESYYQEAGRAGRDGEKAFCILLHSGRDNSLHNFFINNSKSQMSEQGKTPEQIQSVLNVKYEQLRSIQNYIQSEACRRKFILEYFSDPAVKDFEEGCKSCDRCLGHKWSSAPLRSEYRATEGLRNKSIDKKGDISGTIMETVKLYKEKQTIEEIAKIRSISERTVFGHLITWYMAGGDFKVEDFITPEEEKMVFEAMGKAEDLSKLTPIKEQLPEDFEWDKIKIVIAKIQRIKL